MNPWRALPGWSRRSRARGPTLSPFPQKAKGQGLGWLSDLVGPCKADGPEGGWRKEGDPCVSWFWRGLLVWTLNAEDDPASHYRGRSSPLCIAPPGAEDELLMGGAAGATKATLGWEPASGITLWLQKVLGLLVLQAWRPTHILP